MFLDPEGVSGGFSPPNINMARIVRKRADTTKATNSKVEEQGLLIQ